MLFVIDTGWIRTGVDKISRCCFFGAAGFDASLRFLMDGIVNDCSVISVLELCDVAVEWSGDCTVEPLPNVDCTKFVEFLNSLVKLLVLNESKPLDVVDVDADTDAFDVAFSLGVESALPRKLFVLWLNIILTFSYWVKSFKCSYGEENVDWMLFGGLSHSNSHFSSFNFLRKKSEFSCFFSFGYVVSNTFKCLLNLFIDVFFGVDWANDENQAINVSYKSLYNVIHYCFINVNKYRVNKIKWLYMWQLPRANAHKYVDWIIQVWASCVVSFLLFRLFALSFSVYFFLWNKIMLRLNFLSESV